MAISNDFDFTLVSNRKEFDRLKRAIGTSEKIVGDPVEFPCFIHGEYYYPECGPDEFHLSFLYPEDIFEMLKDLVDHREEYK